MGRIGFHNRVRQIPNEAREEFAGGIAELGFNKGQMRLGATQSVGHRHVRPVVPEPVLATWELVLVVVHQVVQVCDGFTPPQSSLAAIFVVTSQSDVRKEKEQTFSNATIAMPAKLARFTAPVGD